MPASPAGHRRAALLVATSKYDDPGLAQLVSPAHDATALADVLATPDIGDFEVVSVQDATSAEICQAVEDFVAERDRGDLVLLYLSCHGLKDEQGRLYFAARNTRRDRLRSTAVSAGFVNDILFGCQSRRKVLLLDCCYSGAFAKGLAVKADPSVHTQDQFDARGLVVLTASDATQYAFEGDTLTGVAAPSVFTASLAEGLRTGAADIDADGLVSVDDVYEYARRRLADQPRPQSPRKWEFDVAGSIVLARSPVGEWADLTPDLTPDLPPVLSAVPASAPREHPATGSRVQQGAWWLGALFFLAVAVASSLLLTYVVDFFLLPLVSDKGYLPAHRGEFIAAGIGGAAWAVAYAAVDATRPAPGRRSDVVRSWLAIVDAVFRPLGIRQFWRAARAAVPLNVTATVALAVAAAALGYAKSGSETRETTFKLTFVLVTLTGVVLFIARGRGPATRP